MRNQFWIINERYKNVSEQVETPQEIVEVATRKGFNYEADRYTVQELTSNATVSLADFLHVMKVDGDNIPEGATIEGYFAE